MSEYKSEVKHIWAPVDRVYGKLSDLTNMAAIQQNLDNPMVRQQIMQQSEGKLTEEKLDEIVEKIRSLEFTPDSVSGDAPAVGRVTLRIIEREENKTIKFALEGVPIDANLWIQLLPAAGDQCAMRAVVKADLNFFIKQMVGSKLQQGVEGLADMLSKLPY